jgi:hypothetical protein
MKVEICYQKNYEAAIKSNLYDYLVLAEESATFSLDFLNTVQSNIDGYNPDFIYTDYSINHNINKFVEKIFCKTLIFGELKKKPDWIRCPVVKTSVIKKYGVDLDKIIRDFCGSV